MKNALRLAELKFDLVPKRGRRRLYAPVFATVRGKQRVVGKRRVRVASCDGTHETERELARRMNWLRNRIAEAA